MTTMHLLRSNRGTDQATVSLKWS